MFNSCLLPIWCGVQLLAKWIRDKKIDAVFIKESAGHWLIIIMWLISMAYELTGGRADSVGDHFSVVYLWECIKTLIRRYMSLNHMMELVLLLCVGLHVIFLIQGKKIYAVAILKIVAVFILTSLYLVLLCAKVGKWYLGSTTYINTTIVMLLFVYFTLGICIKEYPQTCVLAPLTVGVLFYNINTSGTAKTFKDCNWINDNLSAYECSTYLVNSIKNAEENGATTIEIEVPHVGDGDNWPLVTTYGGSRVWSALYKHNVIGGQMEVTLVENEDLNFLDMK